MTDEEYKRWIRDAQIRGVVKWAYEDNFWAYFWGIFAALLVGLILAEVGGWVIGTVAGIIAYILVFAAFSDDNDN